MIQGRMPMSMSSVPSWALLAALICPGPMPAAAVETEVETPTAPLRLALAEAQERARRASPRLQELDARIAAAEAEHRLARAARLPEITASAGYARFSDVPELKILEPGVGLVTIFPNIPDNYQAHLDMTVPLYTGGRIEGSVTAAEKSTEAARRSHETGSADLELEVTVAYWDLVVARQREEVLAKAIASFEAHLTDTRNLLRFGMAARNDVLAVEVERQRAELERLQAEAGAAIAQANLVRLLDLAPGTSIEAVEGLESPGQGPEELEALVSAALAQRPERLTLLARIGAADAGVKVAQAGRKPLVGATAGYQYDQPNRNIVPPEEEFRDSWQVAFNVSVDLFDGGRTAAEVARAKAQAEAARHQLKELERGIRLEVTARYVELETARAAVEVAERNVEAAQENLRVTGNRYLEGLIPSSERLDAETRLLQADLDHTRVLTSVRLAEARLDRTLGR
jgi:outer membrane protein